MSNYIIRFYEGSYQYNAIEVETPPSTTELFTGILEEFNHQYNYRPTNQDLWATVIMDGAEIYRVERLNNGTVQVREASKFDQPYKFMPLEAYTLTQLAIL
jgi:hypothetical protein